MTRFGETDDWTVGVEEEFFLVDPDSGDPAHAIEDLLEAVPDGREENVHAEFYPCVVETATDVCADHAELAEEVRDLRRLVSELAREAGARTAATGTHPWARWEEIPVTDKPRYHETVDMVGWAALWELVCGQHVHLAVPSSEDAIFVHNRIRAHLPTILAVSTNSPFWRGEATGYMSSRIPVWDIMPRSGMPRAFDGWADFEHTVEGLRAGGAIDDVTRIWWDVRPRPDMGTVEVRIADMPLRVGDSLALAGLVQTLARRLCIARRRDEDLPPLPPQDVIEENRDRAFREGLGAVFIRGDGDGFETVRAPQAVQDLLDFVGDVPAKQAARPAIDRLETIAEREWTGADRQLAVRNRGSLQDVVADIVEETPP